MEDDSTAMRYAEAVWRTAEHRMHLQDLGTQLALLPPAQRLQAMIETIKTLENENIESANALAGILRGIWGLENV